MRSEAWGARGHRLVATLAQSQLSDEAKGEIDRLLALEPGATLALISTAADDERTPLDAPWHYVNFGRDAQCRYDSDRSCAGGRCVVAAIDRQSEVLRSSAPDSVRLHALKYVVHLVADVHQPLHAGFADDRGGNRYQVQSLGRRGTNLHAIWDVDLLDSWPGGAPSLLEELEKQRPFGGEAVGAQAWAEESCRLLSGDDFYPEGHRINDAYLAR